MQNFNLPLLGAFCEQFQFLALNRPKRQSELYYKNSDCVCSGYRSGCRGCRGYISISGGRYCLVADQISERREIEADPYSWKVKLEMSSVSVHCPQVAKESSVLHPQRKRLLAGTKNSYNFRQN